MLQARSNKPSFKIALLIMIIGLLGLIATIVASRHFSLTDQKKIAALTSATIFSEPRELKPFALNTPSTPFSQSSLRQHWTLLFFGFTHCSDVCPTTLATLKEVYQGLHPRLPELQVVFVSVDPERDTLAHLRSYLAAFNSNFIAATGTPEQLHRLQEQAGIFVEKASSQIAHTSSVLLINPQGQWVALFPYGMPAQQMRVALEKIKAL